MHFLITMGWRQSLFCFKNNLILLVSILTLFLKVAESSSSNTVKFLPGFGSLPFHLQTGYVEVGEPEDDLHIFYYFVESERNPEQDPIVVWFTGGPGCSSFSAFNTIGPLQFNTAEYDGSLPTLFYNPHRWSKICSMLFLDLPVGTGFSYPFVPSQRSDSKQVQHAVQFLRKWLVDHQQYLSNPVYLGGESYSGLTVPAYCLEIVESNEKDLHPRINFQGYILGNPGTTNKSRKYSQIRFAHGTGLIPDELYESLMKNCGAKDQQFIDGSNVECLGSMQEFDKNIAKINSYYILDPDCENIGRRKSLMGRSFHEQPELFLKSETSVFNSALECRHYRYILAEHWANDLNVQRALGVRETIRKWKRCIRKPYEYDIPSSYEFIAKLSLKGYPSLIYSGDHDMTVPHIETQALLRSLNYTIVDDWRPWFVEDQVGGYTRAYSNKMTFATVKGAGHVAPDYRPKECHAMFERWISKRPL